MKKHFQPPALLAAGVAALFTLSTAERVSADLIITFSEIAGSGNTNIDIEFDGFDLSSTNSTTPFNLTAENTLGIFDVGNDIIAFTDAPLDFGDAYLTVFDGIGGDSGELRDITNQGFLNPFIGAIPDGALPFDGSVVVNQVLSGGDQVQVATRAEQTTPITSSSNFNTGYAWSNFAPVTGLGPAPVFRFQSASGETITVQWSATAVPEPSGAVLGFLAMLPLFRRRRS